MQITIADVTCAAKRNSSDAMWAATAMLSLRNVGAEATTLFVSGAMLVAKQGSAINWPELVALGSFDIRPGGKSDPIELAFSLPLDEADLALTSGDRTLLLRVTVNDRFSSITTDLSIALQSIAEAPVTP